MNTYLGFIDESGNYRSDRTPSFTKRYPYYVKACVLIPSDRWPLLKSNRQSLLAKLGISPLQELKWNHIWKLRRRDIDGKSLTLAANEHFLENISFEQADTYAKELIRALPTYDPVVICTITPNCVFWHRVGDINLERLHFQNLMQRVEMEMNTRKENSMAILFADRLSDRNQELDICNRYSELFYNGDLIKKYDHIFDTLNFSDSRQCCGLQLADFVAGFIIGFLRGFPISKDVVALSIMDEIRKGAKNDKMGYGIIDVPGREESREHLRQRFEHTLPF